MTVGEHRFAIALADAAAARAFTELLPLTLDMSDLNDNEKKAMLPRALPTSESRPGTIRSGDIMLYGTRTLVVFYSTFRLAVLVFAPRSPGRPHRPGAGARTAWCATHVFRGKAIRERQDHFG
jgi:hypothetical protein